MKTPKKPIKVTHPALPVTTPALAPPTVSEPSAGAAGAASPAPSGSAVFSAPPDITLPPIPAGFVPMSLLEYRGWHPKAAQLSAAPDAVTELLSFSGFGQLFGTAVPPASQLASEIDSATRWTAARVLLEAFLAFTKCGEAVSWKIALSDLDKLDPVVQIVNATNPAALVDCPALVRMIDAPKAIAQRAAATRVRKTKAEKAAAAAVPPAPSPAPATSGGGTSGATH